MIDLVKEVYSFSFYLNAETINTTAYFLKELDHWKEISDWVFEPHWFQGYRERKAAEQLLPKIRNIEYRAILETIKDIKSYNDIDNWFSKWIELIQSFTNLCTGYINPLFYDCMGRTELIFFEDDEVYKEGIQLFLENDINLSVIFETTEYKKGNVTLFDSITGLDKNNNLTFIEIIVENRENDNIRYEYSYVKDGTIKSNNKIEEIIEIEQLELIRKLSCDVIVSTIELLFDYMIDRRLNTSHKCGYSVFSSHLIKNRYKDIRKQWLRNSIIGINQDGD